MRKTNFTFIALATTVVLLLSAAILSNVNDVEARTASSTADLKASHVGSSNPGFTTEEDDRCPSGQWGWHFVMPDKDTSFISLTATFTNAGTVNATAFYDAGPQTNKHAYVFTPGPDTLLGATASVDGPSTEFNLSHVCNGTTTVTTLSEPTTTTTIAKTTTTVPKTTTTVPKTTTTAPTTTVPETTTTTVHETTTTVPDTTTTTESVETTTTAKPSTTTTTPATTATVAPVIKTQPAFTG